MGKKTKTKINQLISILTNEALYGNASEQNAHLHWHIDISKKNLIKK